VIADRMAYMSLPDKRQGKYVAGLLIASRNRVAKDGGSATNSLRLRNAFLSFGRAFSR
jgi:hypothetical protein